MRMLILSPEKLGVAPGLTPAVGLAYHTNEAVLDGELAVPCTRNPL